MTSEVGRRPAPVAPTITGPSLISRVYGFGSVYGKTMRDSRRAVLIEVLFLGLFLLLVLAGVGAAYATPEARDEIARLAAELGSAGGLVGPIVNAGTMGGYVTYRYAVVFGIIAAAWPVLALSGTIAGEAGRGSLDILAMTPLSRRRIAATKVAAHLTLLGITACVVALAAWAGGLVFARLPGDEIPAESAAGFGLWIALLAAWFGSLAFAMSQFLGRGAGAWTAGIVLLAGPLLINYRAVVPGFDIAYELTPWWWTWDQAAALAGRFSWASLVPVAITAAILIGIGIEAFARRDIGGSAAILSRIPRLPSVGIGLGGPLGRSFAERSRVGLAWGISIGAFGFLMVGASHTLADRLAGSPELLGLFERFFPGVDLSGAGGVLQLLMQLLYVVAGIAAATLVSGWSSDETSGRLEVILASPISRARWAARSGLGVLASIGVFTVIAALGVAAGAAAAGAEPLTPAAGIVALGLFGAAVAAIGLAVGGLGRPSIAAGSVVLVVAATSLIDLIVPALNLSQDLRQLALTAHLGQPMVGVWDWTGIVASVALAGGGLLLGAWGFARRDLKQ